MDEILKCSKSFQQKPFGITCTCTSYDAGLHFAEGNSGELKNISDFGLVHSGPLVYSIHFIFLYKLVLFLLCFYTSAQLGILVDTQHAVDVK